jgi:hypothetical protein
MALAEDSTGPEASYYAVLNVSRDASYDEVSLLA